ncbi:hypothetical protein KGA66_15325 [Actinocrinis puniceicyclus]|uniref:Acyl carrier protein n=1 Tax=Actinocrinis puniceicyclus TaxID=977794 RepID=A0A8J7WN79_9ACTN|nr:hypothetical protein [Actinocrinis puniceicyclus]MBS2964428.1 hypothetical protein [Actinocrinis puniceicyclus]
MSRAPLLERSELVEIIAALGGRDPRSVDETLGSLELTWLVTELEQRYAVVLELSEAHLARIATVTDALDVLNSVLTTAAPADAGR